MVDVRALHTTDGEIIDLVTHSHYGKEGEFRPWLVPSNIHGHHHPLIMSNDPYYRRDIGQADTRIDNGPKVIAVDLFIPTSGYSNWSATGNVYIDHSLRPQQLDFLMSFFENWEDLNCILLLSFCDESPELTLVLETVYSLMAIYEIPHERVKFTGHNFAGQEVLTAFAKENGEKPLTYIVNWWMLGHVDTTHVELLVERSYQPQEELVGLLHQTYSFNPVDMSPKNNTFIFLNRRETDNRLALLYLLWQKGVKHVDSIISAFPPLRLFAIEPGAHEGERNHYTTVFFKSMLKDLVPSTATEHTDVETHNFKYEMKLGESLPGDHAFIGDTESKFVPLNNDAYIWLTCESTSDLKEKNLFFTEKVLKPMMYGQALMVFAQPGFIKAFKALGFHTLCEEYGISEEYDNVEDDAQRIDMIAEEIIKVGSVPLLKMHEIHATLEDKIIENKKRMWLMLSNIPDQDAFVWQAHNSMVSQIHGNKLYNTEESLKLYKDFWNLDIIGTK